MQRTTQLSDPDYLRRVERLAHDVVEAAAVQDWLAFGETGRQADDPLHRAVNELATNLRVTRADV